MKPEKVNNKTREGNLNDTKEITLDEMIAWVKADPEKVKRLIKAERYMGLYGKIELYYQNGECGPPKVQPIQHIE